MLTRSGLNDRVPGLALWIVIRAMNIRSSSVALVEGHRRPRSSHVAGVDPAHRRGNCGQLGT
jgi:hypothetical protein